MLGRPRADPIENGQCWPSPSVWLQFNSTAGLELSSSADGGLLVPEKSQTCVGAVWFQTSEPRRRNPQPCLSALAA